MALKLMTRIALFIDLSRINLDTIDLATTVLHTTILSRVSRWIYFVRVLSCNLTNLRPRRIISIDERPLQAPTK